MMSLYCLAVWYLELQHDHDIDDPVHMLALWDLHDSLNLLKNENLSLRHNRDVHIVLDNGLHLRNLSGAAGSVMRSPTFGQGRSP